MTTRYLLDVDLQPAIGSRFQPTGFPDIGHAEFSRPGGDRCVLVESAQSMANRLEGTAWDGAANQPTGVFDGLPYVRVVADDDGRYLTSSRVEAHRLASAWVKDSSLDGVSMIDVLKERLGLRQDTPTSLRQVAGAVFALDPFCLVHGVFFADNKWPGQPKLARALTGFIEAIDVQRADSGGVKKDHVRHSLDGEGSGTAEGYGTVPYHRTEWTARTITASFSLDRRQLMSYGLGVAAADLLEAIAHWEVRALLDGGLRLRTACDLVPTTDDVVARGGDQLPAQDELDERVRLAIRACSGQLGAGEPIEVRWSDGGKRAKK